MILVNTIGFALILFIIWWFWLYQPKKVKLANKNLQVVVENGVYQPAHISLQADQSVSLTFLRKDTGPCAEQVVFPELELTESLPIDKLKKVNLPNLKPGVYHFHCQMNMYKGELHVK